ncbi:hypothetical protein ACOSQ4_015982 [Xanthoceras sorbifolium]
MDMEDFGLRAVSIIMILMVVTVLVLGPLAILGPSTAAILSIFVVYPVIFIVIRLYLAYATKWYFACVEDGGVSSWRCFTCDDIDGGCDSVSGPIGNPGSIEASTNVQFHCLSINLGRHSTLPVSC